MRGFLIVTIAVLTAIAIGVVIEWSSSSHMPPVLAQAIARTMAVQSAEVTQTFPSPNAGTQVGTGIYNRPNLWEGAFSLTGGSIQTRGVFVGNSEYVETQGGSPAFRSSLVLNMHEPIATVGNVGGRTPAQRMAFSPLIDALQGSGFHDVSGLWTVHLNLGVSTVRVTGGTIEVSGGVVTRATTTEVQNGHTMILSYRYMHLNSAPRIAIPANARSAG